MSVQLCIKYTKDLNDDGNRDTAAYNRYCMEPWSWKEVSDEGKQ